MSEVCPSCNGPLDLTVVGTDDRKEAIWACLCCGRVIQVGVNQVPSVISIQGDLDSVLAQLRSSLG